MSVEPVVHDGPLLTSRRPADVPQFTDAILAALAAQEAKAS